MKIPMALREFSAVPPTVRGEIQAGKLGNFPSVTELRELRRFSVFGSSELSEHSKKKDR